MSGQLSRQDFINESKKEGGLKIMPFNEDINLKLASYDITPTLIAMSSRLGMLETVYRVKEEEAKYYILVKAKDTVQVVSKEFISVPPNIAGYVVSRVSKVSEGFGHVSTSIDPNWKGALLIGLSNPTRNAIKVYVGGKREPATKGNALATISFHYLNTPCESTVLRPYFPGMRSDLLTRIKYTERTGIRAWINRIIHFRRREFTKEFFNYMQDRDIDESTWEGIANTLCGITEESASGNKSSENSGAKKNRFDKFIVNENIMVRIVHGIQARKKYLAILAVIIFVYLWGRGVIPDAVKERILEYAGLFSDLLDALFKFS